MKQRITPQDLDQLTESVKQKPLTMPKTEETPLEYFLRMLEEEKMAFSDLLAIYVGYLEGKNSRQRKDIAEAAFLLSMWENPKLNQGTHKQLTDRTAALIDKSGVFPKR